MNRLVAITAILGVVRFIVWLEAEANYAKVPYWIQRWLWSTPRP